MQFPTLPSTPAPSTPSAAGAAAPSTLDDGAADAKADTSFAALLPNGGKPSGRGKSPQDHSPKAVGPAAGSASGPVAAPTGLTSAQGEAAAVVAAAAHWAPATPVPVAPPLTGVAFSRGAKATAATIPAVSAASPALAPVQTAGAGHPALASAMPAPAATAATAAVSAKVAAKAAGTEAAPAADEEPEPASPASAAPSPAPVAATPPAVAAGLGAKIAVPPGKGSPSEAPAKGGELKKVQANESKELTDSPPVLGTAVARLTAIMPSATSTDRTPVPTLTPPVGTGATASTGGAAWPASGSGETPSASPSEAVQAALTTAEMLTASNANKAVNLQFSVAGADLSLRVQLLNGQVHATFSTDSTQLRSALSSEWQSMTSSSGANVHLAEPVFTASGGGSFLSGDGASRQGGRQAAEDFAAIVPSSLSSLRSGASPAAAAAPAASAPVAAAGSLHLQTFA